MAQTGFTPILIYASSTPSAVPSASNLTSTSSGAELALNYSDGKLFYKDSGGVVQVLAGKGGSGVVAGSNTQVQFNNNGVFGASSGLTWDGTNLTATQLRSSGLTSGRVTYASTSGLLVDSANMTFNGTVLTVNTLSLTNALSTANGGTGVTSFTANRVFYALSTSALGQSANLTFDGTTLTANALTTTSTVTINGGTANGVAYLNASNVLTTGSALVFNGTQLGINGSPSQALDVTADAPAIAAFRSIGSSGNDKRLLITSGGDNIRLDSANQSGGAASMAFSIGSTEQMRLTSTGLGIGTSSPGTRLHLKGATNQVSIKLENPQSRTFQILSNGSTGGGGASTGSFAIYDETAGADRLTIDASGNLGLGTSSPASLLDVSKTGDAIVSLTSAGVQRYQLIARSSGNFEVYDQSSAASRLTLTQSGNLGLGVTPSAWFANSRAIDIGTGGAVQGRSNDATTFELATNAYLDSAGTWRYKTTNRAGLLGLSNGTYAFNIAASGTAGNAITFTQAMTLDASGNLGVGTTSPASNSVSIVRGAGVGVSVEIAGNGNTPASTSVTISQANDNSAYVWNRANSFLSFGTNNTERARIDSSGNFGIAAQKVFGSGNGYAGNTSAASSATLELWDTNGNTKLFNVWGSGNLLFGTANTERARIDSSGNLGIGTTSPASLLDVATSGVVTATIRSTSTGGTRDAKLRLNVPSTGGDDPAGTVEFTYGTGYTVAGSIQMTHTNNNMKFFTGTTERARITSGGDLLVGTTSGSDKIVVDQSATASASLFINSSGTAAAQCVNAWHKNTTGDNVFLQFYTEASATLRGSITYNRGGGVVAYNTTSDYRAKDIIGPVANPGATIDGLKVYMGKMKGATIERPMMIAHEAQEVVPFCVSGAKDETNEDGTPKYQQMDHASLVPLLIAELQSLRARVAQLEAKGA